MVTVFSDLDMISLENYNSWLEKASTQRRDYVLKYRFYKDRLLSISAYKLLCYTLKNTNVEFYYNEYRKPMLKEGGECFNMTHCDGLVACITDHSPVGIDAERIKSYPRQILDKVFTKMEIQQIDSSKNPDYTFLKLWTLKESYIKALGLGMYFPLHDVEFILLGNDIICSDKKYLFSSYTVGDCIISVCSQDSQSLFIVGMDELSR